jgi:hypothetical protein
VGSFKFQHPTSSQNSNFKHQARRGEVGSESARVQPELAIEAVAVSLDLDVWNFSGCWMLEFEVSDCNVRA